ncbi:MAG: hypothetical protein NT118_07380 [Lentisphaerae bacterium]|nr:hypothetical protein [Lentisphaerota bacterium]
MFIFFDIPTINLRGLRFYHVGGAIINIYQFREGEWEMKSCMEQRQK